ncbi:hypothetical protein [Clostridium arbusti]|uniref:hypothetical protein n=1 Tax=Clostridium arbusti TaxID=1137848 RepID=UPI000288300D|nr:hypothetical protein [Clostridium arbusti]
MRDYKAELKTAERKGIEKGREEGMEKGKIEVAKSFLRMGLSIEQIAAGTGLTVEEIRKLES